jgi:hypothetical protein
MAEALSLAAAIFQFADYARKLTQWTIEIYNSAQGTTEEMEILKNHAKEVENSITNLRKEALESNCSGWEKALDEQEREAIKKLALEAELLAIELQERLAKLKGSGPSRGRPAGLLASGWHAMKLFFTLNELKELDAKINALQNTMSHRIVKFIL